jgi:hypothetical protein
MLQPFIRWTRPPNTTSTWPLTSPAASLASHATTGATLSGLHSSNPASGGAATSPNSASVIRVRARGAIALTVTP